MGFSVGTEVFCMVISSALLSKQNIIPPILSEDILHGNEDQLMHSHRKVDKKVKYEMKERLKQMRQHNRNGANDT
jgi:hypothetical protein